MAPSELLAKCNDQIAAAGEETVVVLVLRNRKAKGDTVRLFGRRGPVGRVYSDIDGLTVGFKAKDVRDFVLKEIADGS